MTVPRSSLRFCDDSAPGITRRRRGRYWQYFDADGGRITDREEIERLNRIRMPPAYKRCWFSPDARGHLQATGFDARGRKQYRYHTDFRAQREAGKFGLCGAFGAALPRLRVRVEQDLAFRKPGRDRAIAAIVRLLDIGLIRIGNARYAEENGSYGATTLEARHAELRSRSLRLSFRAKSGKERELVIRDPGLVRFVRQMQDLPGQRLFRYVDEDGEAHDIGSAEVNAYIQEHMGAPFTAKHFRTWGGSVVAFATLASAKERISLKEMIAPVAEQLSNTAAISRKSYIHPALTALCQEGQEEWRATLRLPRATQWLTREERGLIALLESSGD
ncbi:MAG TPA: DNA topoisomerase IB [Croceibacterium sp.]|nr:DNA topoisomerase IB [Croceibacterium sp.]